MKNWPILFLLAVSVLGETPNDLVDIQKLNPDIQVSLVYSSEENFLGADVYGDLERCFLRKEVAEMLSSAQDLLQKERNGFRLLVFDGLRPLDVQRRMWDLVKGTDKQKYVADPKTGSIHNYGAAVDLTIVDSSGTPLDMGTPFDFFGELAQPRFEQKLLSEGMLTQEQLENRLLLRNVMQEAGFKGISVEWWHFDAFPKEKVRKRFTIVDSLGSLVGGKTE